jgi:hypothetical protein
MYLLHIILHVRGKQAQITQRNPDFWSSRHQLAIAVGGNGGLLYAWLTSATISWIYNEKMVSSHYFRAECASEDAHSATLDG